MKDAADLGGLKAYLSGMGRNNPAALAFVAGYAEWPKLASQELERRAAALLAGLVDDELLFIASAQLDLCQFARQVQAELSEEW